MEGPLKELAKLQKLVSDSSSSKGKSPSINDSLDSLLQSLREVKDRLQHGTATDETLTILSKTVETRKKEIDDRQKEVYNAIAKVGKALDKVCCLVGAGYSRYTSVSQRFQTPLPTYSPLFTSPEANAALERTIALHFLRTGQFKTAETFIEVRIVPFALSYQYAEAIARNRMSTLTQIRRLNSRSFTRS